MSTTTNVVFKEVFDNLYLC